MRPKASGVNRRTVRTHFRLIAVAAAALGAAWGTTAFADWPFGKVARLQPGYGGVCEDCDLSGRILAGVRITNGNFRRTDFSHAVLARADGSGSVFEGANFAEADLTRAKLVGARCAGARFPNAILNRTDASDADFSRADFGRATLEQSRLVRANFSHAQMHGARLTGANLSGADLRRARGLTQAQMQSACGDAHTQLPRGLTIARCEDPAVRRGHH